MNFKKNLKLILKKILPPIVWDIRSALFGEEVFTYIQEGWSTIETNPTLKEGWNHKSIAQTQLKKWAELKSILEGNFPLGINHESSELSSNDLISHNTLVSFAYVITLTASQNSGQISFLDWGGGLGQYYLIAQAVLPNIKLDYYCKDLDIFKQDFEFLLPNANFLSSDLDLDNRQYNLVMASGSLMYVEDWCSSLSHLCKMAKDYLFITRLTVTLDSNSYVVQQRPYAVGYNTEYLLWVINQDEFLEYVDGQGMELVRIFLVGESLSIKNAPSQCYFRGYLFKPL